MAEFRSQAEKVQAQMPHPVVPKSKRVFKKLWGTVKMTHELDLRGSTYSNLGQTEVQHR